MAQNQEPENNQTRLRRELRTLLERSLKGEDVGTRISEITAELDGLELSYDDAEIY